MKKKLLSSLMALCMALSLLPAAALAADTTAATTTTADTTAATTTAAKTLPFTDVASGDWCYDAVSYVYDNGLLKGVTATSFAPNGSMNRAMLISALYRLAGSPAVTGADTGVWYGAAKAWAVASKISDGSNMTAALSRQQLVTLLYKYAQYKSLGLGLPAVYSENFSDASSVAAYAADAMQWAYGNGILSGKTAKTLAPAAGATRAQVAAILYRFLSGNSTKFNAKNVTFASADGTMIPATVTVPVGASNCPGVVMLHGTGSSRDEAGNGYKTAAPILAAKYGIASVRIDFRGNGESTASYMDYTFSTAVADAVAAAKYLGTVSGVSSSKIGVMGWSQGGTDALLAAGQHTDIFKCVVTWAGAPDLSSMLSDTDYAAAKKDGYFTMTFDWRSSLKVSLQWCEDVKNTDVLKVFKGYTGPVLAIAGTNDTTVDPSWSTKIVAASTNKASATHFIKGMDHTFNVFSEANLASLNDAVDATGTYFAANLK
jgi:Dipeptidyl aminopeptidases/acylaminoacyl-peptidases